MRLSRRLAAFASCLALVPIVVAVLTAAPVRGGTTHHVAILDFAFSPATITIAAGDAVTWTNEDAVTHTETGISGIFDSGDLGPGESFSFTFTTPGTYDYLCTPHPTMTGRIVVLAASAATPQPDGPPAASSEPLPDVAMRPPNKPTPPGAAAMFAAVGVLAAALIVRIRWHSTER